MEKQENNFPNNGEKIIFCQFYLVDLLIALTIFQLNRCLLYLSNWYGLFAALKNPVARYHDTNGNITKLRTITLLICYFIHRCDDITQCFTRWMSRRSNCYRFYFRTRTNWCYIRGCQRRAVRLQWYVAFSRTTNSCTT